MAEFRMPSLGADMEAGTVVQWLVQPGAAVKRGDVVAVVDTEKAAIEIEIFEAGVIRALLVSVGEKVPVGAVLALIAPLGEAVAAGAPVAPELLTPSLAPAYLAKPAPMGPLSKPSGRLRVSPLAMRAATELGVNLATVRGTGPDSAITKADVERMAKAAPPSVLLLPPRAPLAEAPSTPPVETAAAAPPTKPAGGGVDRQAAMRRVIAAAMARSKREIPHYYLGTDIDMSRALAWLQAENLKRPVTERLLYAVMLLKAVALSVHAIPEMNGFWVDGVSKPSASVHVGVAISLRQGGLIAPAIHDVDKKSLEEIMVNLRDLVKRVRAGVLRSSEIADSTITVTSLGEQGVEEVYGIIYPPQVALVGFGKITERPWAAGGMIGARPILRATLAADHRASDGHRGGLFLAAVNRALQESEKL